MPELSGAANYASRLINNPDAPTTLLRRNALRAIIFAPTHSKFDGLLNRHYTPVEVDTLKGVPTQAHARGLGDLLIGRGLFECGSNDEIAANLKVLR